MKELTNSQLTEELQVAQHNLKLYEARRETLLKEQEYALKRKESLEKLEKNKLFKELITDGFLKDLALSASLNHASAQVGPEMNKTLNANTLIAVGRFNDYLRSIRTAGAQSFAKELSDNAQYIEAEKQNILNAEEELAKDNRSV